jgi:hypothetical protein
MPGAFLEIDLTTLLETNVFASSAIRVTGEVVNGIFQDAGTAVETEDGRTVVMQEATFTCKTSAGLTYDEQIQIGDDLFTIKHRMPDGTGLTVHMMQKDS